MTHLREHRPAPSRSVPTEDCEKWYAAGWRFCCIDFDQANHTIVIWTESGHPREPAQ